MSGKKSLRDKNKAEIERLSKLNVMLEIRRQALDIQVRLMDSDIKIEGGQGRSKFESSSASGVMANVRFLGKK